MGLYKNQQFCRDLVYKFLAYNFVDFCGKFWYSGDVAIYQHEGRCVYVRQWKPGEFVNVKVEIDLVRRLKKYVEETGFTKTAVVEKALRMYLDAVAPVEEGVEN